jgi:hypothetical protein
LDITNDILLSNKEEKEDEVLIDMISKSSITARKSPLIERATNNRSCARPNLAPPGSI